MNRLTLELQIAPQLAALPSSPQRRGHFAVTPIGDLVGIGQLWGRGRELRAKVKLVRIRQIRPGDGHHAGIGRPTNR
jgi:hypothetical protein